MTQAPQLRPHALTKYRHVDYPEVSWLTNVEETGQIDWYGVKRATDCLCARS